MPTVLGPQLPLSYANTPAGMSLQDNLIWQRFRIQRALDYDTFYANVRVGEGAQPLEHFDPITSNLLRTLTQHRIDIILMRGQTPTIMEVRNNAGSGALGTILTNTNLYLKDPILGTQIKRAILTNNIDQDSRSAVEAQGVQVIVV